MKLGMPTLIEFNTIEQNVELCAELGLQFVELNMNLPFCTPEQLNAESINLLRDRCGVDFTLHLPEEIDLGSFHPSVRTGHLACCIKAVRWAGASGIRLVNMHFHQGIYFTLPDRKVWVNERHEAEFARHVCQAFEELLDAAAESNVQICVENTMNFHLPFMERTLNRLLALEHFHLTWDVGHDGKSGFREQPFFEKHRERIRHMHLHDCNSLSDHQPLYTGAVPIDDRLQFAKELDLSVVVEVKTSASLRESIQRLKNR